MTRRLTPIGMLRLSEGGNHNAALRYLEARRRSAEARVSRVDCLARGYYDMPLLKRMLDRAVEDAEVTEEAALTALEDDPRDSWDLGGGVRVVRVKEGGP